MLPFPICVVGFGVIRCVCLGHTRSAIGGNTDVGERQVGNDAATRYNRRSPGRLEHGNQPPDLSRIPPFWRCQIWSRYRWSRSSGSFRMDCANSLRRFRRSQITISKMELYIFGATL